MLKESTTTHDDLNLCNAQSVGMGDLVVPISTTGISVSETTHNSFLNGTQIAYGSVIEKTTGTPFQIDFVGSCIVKYAYFYNSSIESLLSFLDIVNNKDGWSFLQQRCVNSIINN